MISKHGRLFINLEIHGVCKGLWAFFRDCPFWVLIGWAGKLQSRDRWVKVQLSDLV